MPTWNDFVAHPELRRRSGSGRRCVPYLDARHGADAERRRLVGPGGFLRAAQDLRGAGEARHAEPELPRRRPVEPRRLGARRRATSSARSTFGSGDRRSTSARKVQAPFFAHYLKDKGTLELPEALMFQTGRNRWRTYDRWPPKGAHDAQRSTSTPTAGSSFDAAARRRTQASTSYVSDPAQPGPVPPAADRADLLTRRPEWHDVAGRGPAVRRTRRPDVLS